MNKARSKCSKRLWKCCRNEILITKATLVLHRMLLQDINPRRSKRKTSFPDDKTGWREGQTSLSVLQTVNHSFRCAYMFKQLLCMEKWYPVNSQWSFDRLTVMPLVIQPNYWDYNLGQLVWIKNLFLPICAAHVEKDWDLGLLTSKSWFSCHASYFR